MKQNSTILLGLAAFRADGDEQVNRQLNIDWLGAISVETCHDINRVRLAIRTHPVQIRDR